MPTYTRVDNNGQTSLVQIDNPELLQLLQGDETRTVTAAPSQRASTVTVQTVAAEPVAVTVQEKAVGEPLAVDLPAPNFSCYQEPAEPRGETRWLKYNEQTITKNIEQNFNTVKTSVKENNIHHQHYRTVVQNVNRNHYHTHRIIVKDNNYHHYLTNNVIRINDIHHQKIEQVRGEGQTLSDYKQTQRVEGANCQVGSQQAAEAVQVEPQQQQPRRQIISVPQNQTLTQLVATPEQELITVTQQQQPHRPTSTINKIAYIPSGATITNNDSARTIRQFQ